MNRILTSSLIAFSLLTATSVRAEADNRKLVEMPSMMQAHMLSNMRDHLAALNDILTFLANDGMDQASDVAEQRLGMSSLDDHGAEHMAPHMPEGMQQAGTRMHQAASRFAAIASEGDPLAAYRALQDVTASCVACHAGYRIR